VRLLLFALHDNLILLRVNPHLADATLAKMDAFMLGNQPSFLLQPLIHVPGSPIFMLNQLTISELAAKLAKREVSAREAMQSCLDQIARVDGKIHAFISHDAADALAQADAADRNCWPKAAAAQAARCSACPSRSRTSRRQKPAAQLRLENPRQIHFALRRDGG
jgi:hypothetical protein